MKVKIGQIYDWNGFGLRAVAPDPMHDDIFHFVSVKDRNCPWVLAYTTLSELVLIEDVS